VTASPPPSNDQVLVGAGDIATCSSSGDEATATLLDNIVGTVITLGDNVYDSGTATEYANCYGPSWGRHRARTRPTPGNHEYNTLNATGYYGYFGAAAGDPSKGYYSYDAGAWHIIVLNSNSSCTTISCAAGSAQDTWLRADLAAHSNVCTLAYWHHPRFNSGASHGNNTAVANFWDALYQYGADVILNGHEHVYERFAPQTPGAIADPTNGIRQFTVGTGGASHYSFGTIQPNSEARNGNTYGVLKLTLHATSYDWQFVPVAGATFTDSGTGNCH
ncbi:MAG: alkaline phosphatase, partial [Gemmatimonadetes bacterium]